MSTPYENLASDIATTYLEDSYVLAITVSPGTVTFEMEIIVLPGNPGYVEPSGDDPRCWRSGRIEFTRVTALSWIGQGAPPSRDSSGIEDLGNIDSLTLTEGVYHVDGDWGQMQITTPTPPILTLEARLETP